MKTTFYLFAFFLSLQFNLNAQVDPYELDNVIPEREIQSRTSQDLKPVFFNYSRRRLYHNNKTPLKGADFLERCRGINDPGIQYQIFRYDELTKNKKKRTLAGILCAVGGYVGFMTSTIMLSSSGDYNQNGYPVMAVSGVALFIATPILFASTTIPHQKRKEILFRDLPEAYNFHVLSQNNK